MGLADDPGAPFHARTMDEMMGARFPEGLIASAVLTGATERIHLLTYILVLPLRHPVMLAKQVATLDFLTGGRFTLGTAVGHMQGEFEVMGVSFKDRGKMADEYFGAERMLDRRQAHLRRQVREFRGHRLRTQAGAEALSADLHRRQHRTGDAPRGEVRRRLGSVVDHGGGAACGVDYMREQPGFAEKEDSFEIVMPTTEYKVEDYSHAEIGKTRIAGERDVILKDIETLAKAGMTGAQVMPPRLDTFEQCLEWVAWFDAKSFRISD